MLNNTLRIKKRNEWIEQGIRIDGNDPLQREKFLFCMQNGLKVQGFPGVEDTTDGIVLPPVSEIVEPDPLAFSEGHYILEDGDWEKQRVMLLRSGIPEGNIHVDLWNLENRKLNYVASNPSSPEFVFRVDWATLEYRYKKGRQLLGELNKNKNIRYIFPCWWGKGDTLLLGSLIKQFREVNADRAIVLLIRRGHENLVSLFPWIDGYHILNQNERVSLETYFAIKGESQFGNVTNGMLSLPWCGLGKNWSNLDGNPTMASVFRKGLSLKPDVGFSMFPEEKLNPQGEHERQLYHKLRAEKNIFIVPQSNGLYMVLEQGRSAVKKQHMIGFFRRLSEAYVREGFKVYCNIGPGEENILPGTESLALSMEELIHVCRCFSGICAIRTGLCDAMALTGAAINIIYPDVKETGMEMFIRATDLSEVNAGVKNYFWSPETELKMIGDLMKGVKS